MCIGGCLYFVVLFISLSTKNNSYNKLSNRRERPTHGHTHLNHTEISIHSAWYQKIENTHTHNIQINSSRKRLLADNSIFTNRMLHAAFNTSQINYFASSLVNYAKQELKGVHKLGLHWNSQRNLWCTHISLHPSELFFHSHYKSILWNFL